MMQIGEAGDKRRFSRKPVGDGVTADVTVDKTPLPKCVVCGLTITGKAWSVAADEFECTRCRNEA